MTCCVHDCSWRVQGPCSVSDIVVATRLGVSRLILISSRSEDVPIDLAAGKQTQQYQNSHMPPLRGDASHAYWLSIGYFKTQGHGDRLRTVDSPLKYGPQVATTVRSYPAWPV